MSQITCYLLQESVELPQAVTEVDDIDIKGEFPDYVEDLQ